MTDKLTKITAIAAIALSLIAIVSVTANGTLKNAVLGAVGTLPIENYVPAIMYNDGYYSEKGITLSGANGDITTGDDLTVTDDLTVSGGALDVTTSNTATSSITSGCFDTTATSTATPIKMVFFASSTLNIDGASITNAFGGAAQQGLVLWGYGSC